MIRCAKILEIPEILASTKACSKPILETGRTSVSLVAVREATDMGPKYIGAHTIAINLWLFSSFFIDGYGAVANIMGGRLLGAKDYIGLWNLAKKITGYGVVVSVVLMLAAFLFYNPIGNIFSN
ncbi:MATE family efflux transporter, partial [Pricia sp.]|uniref:MATE family efflux transporter n=1 Tax=Pricia sp. TaxID=2268138 RepID=UPI0035948056